MEAASLKPYFQDPEKAREYLEQKRWPNGPVCPHCFVLDEATRLTEEQGSRTHARRGLLNCRACRKQFSVTVGTLFEDSHIPLSKWLMAVHLLCAVETGVSASQLQRMLGITYKSAWFMAHRLRYATRQEPLSSELMRIVIANGKAAFQRGEKRRLELRSNKRLSLHPLKFEQTVTDLLKIKPMPKIAKPAKAKTRAAAPQSRKSKRTR